MNLKKKAEQQCQNTWQLSGSALSSVQLQALGGLHYSSVLKGKLLINISDYSDYQITANVILKRIWVRSIILRKDLLTSEENQRNILDTQQQKKLSIFAMPAEDQMDQHVDDTLDYNQEKTQENAIRPIEKNFTKRKPLNKQSIQTLKRQQKSNQLQVSQTLHQFNVMK